MNELKQAIAVSPFPAPCFGGSEPEKQHRRFLRGLAKRATIRLLDSAGTALDMSAVMNGSAHYSGWHVDAQDAQVIVEQIEIEAARLEEERRKAEEARKAQEKRAAEERAAAKRKRGEERQARRAELKAAGLWSHPMYKTLKAARADGWRRPREGEVGGEAITLKGHTLVRNTMRKRYVYKSTLNKVYGLTPAMIDELGKPDDYCTNPHWKTGPYPARLYSLERVEAWIEENKDRVEKAREARAKRSAAAKHVHDGKRAERYRQAQGWVTSLDIAVARPFSDSLLDDARSCYPFQGHEDCLLEKGLHAYVRHRLTNYETLLRALYQQEFSTDLYPLLRGRVDAAVRGALVEWRDKARHSETTTP